MSDDWDRDRGPVTTKERPHFGRRQVRTIDGLKPGKEYFEVCPVGKGFRRKVVVLEKPYEETPGSWWMKVRFLGTGREDTVSLADCSVTAYKGDDGGLYWNATNYLLRA